MVFPISNRQKMADQNLLDDISAHPLIIKLINDLTFNQLYHEKLGVSKKPVSKEDIRKAVWLMSILSISERDEHRNKCQILASLLFLQYPGDETLARAVYVLFSRLGNLTGAKLLKHESKNYFELGVDRLKPSFTYDSSLLLELELEKYTKTINSVNEQITATKFQKDLWEQLEISDRTIISAPTSSGKSFIIKKFLKTKLANTDAYTAIYIVPSRALLNQVSEDLRNEVDLQHVSIKTVFMIDDEQDLEHHIFILTPERCLRLLKYGWKNDFKIDFIL